MQELRDDLEAEKAARDRAENQKRDLKEELEALRLELIDTGSNSEAQAEALRKHEAELTNARKQIEQDSSYVRVIICVKTCSLRKFSNQCAKVNFGILAMPVRMSGVWVIVRCE